MRVGDIFTASWYNKVIWVTVLSSNAKINDQDDTIMGWCFHRWRWLGLEVVWTAVRVDGGGDREVRKGCMRGGEERKGGERRCASEHGWKVGRVMLCRYWGRLRWLPGRCLRRNGVVGVLMGSGH